MSSGRAVSRVRVGPMTEDQRVALADLLGMDRLPAEQVTVSVARLEDVLAETGDDLREVVTRLVGPIADRAGRRAEVAAERAELWEWLTRHPVVVRQPALIDWVGSVRRAGLVGGSVASTRSLLDDVLRVLGELPAAGEPLPVLADRTLRDTHALDDGTRRATMVLRGLATIYDLPLPTDVTQRRQLWERAGVADDELSSVVLVAGMRPPGSGLVSSILRLCADAGQVAALTLGQLRATTWPAGLPDTVWVFENPSVVALALARFGVRCPPVVCTSGWPNSAGILLLRGLASAGCALRYHGDFDGEGIRIAANVAARTGATPWLMGTADYLDALAVDTTGPSVGRVTDAPWDAALADQLRAHDVTVSEERVVDLLLEKLDKYCPTR
ncbi:TIGR02679 family protein [Actinophytocola xinjiangensis]|uniref:TIGR02679 family protein n=1 Tax=Actinophytocola xinjiangensis TaxID=485602 RepID=UPI002482BC98|nr:TIGR02679 family protein [Actinophytocola xinjiangensis]